MRIVCWQTILMKYHTFFLIGKDITKFVVCCSCDWRFMDLAPRWLWLLSVLRRWFCCDLFVALVWGLYLVLVLLCMAECLFLALQSSWWGRVSWWLYFVFLLSCDCSVLWLSLAVPYPVNSVWLWYFLIILTYLMSFLSGLAHLIIF